jgi:A/G-specific adenine glycosylase
MNQSVKRLSEWYLKFARKLPWRESFDPYSIWVSEIMLQQTQVTTVIPYYEKFMKKFPSVQALAGADEAEVLSSWSGLGYYSRAKNLHRGAKYVVETLQGKIPRAREEILKIPGVGPYTAGAILSIAFDLREPLVDGNVQRVFARFFGIDSPLEASATQRLFWDHARNWVVLSDSPRVLNQALMELGATVCVKSNPKCSACPLRLKCIAFNSSRQNELPLKKRRKENVDLLWISLVIESNGKVFLRKNDKKEWWSDLWDFPRMSAVSGDKKKWIEAFEKRFSTLEFQRELDHKKHTVTHHKIRIVPFLVRPKKKKMDLGHGKWVDPEDLKTMPISSLARKVIASYQAVVK